MKVALVHDYLTEYGGAERVLEALHELWPSAPVFTMAADLSALGGDDKAEGTCTEKTETWECVASAPVGVGPKTGKVKEKIQFIGVRE